MGCSNSSEPVCDPISHAADITIQHNTQAPFESPGQNQPDATHIATGKMVQLAEASIRRAAREEEINAGRIELAQLTDLSQTLVNPIFSFFH